MMMMMMMMMMAMVMIMIMMTNAEPGSFDGLVGNVDGVDGRLIEGLEEGIPALFGGGVFYYN